MRISAVCPRSTGTVISTETAEFRLLIVGCFPEAVAAITILTPVLLPIATGLDVDPVHFG